MKLEDLIEHLVAFGFEEPEARIYYHLTRIAPARASEIAQAAGIERTRTYRLLDRLTADGVVERTLERPQRFYPQDLQEVLEARMARKRAAVDALEASIDEVVERWPDRGREKPPEETTFRVVEGREQIGGLLGRMIEGAQQEVMIAAPRRGLARLDATGVLDALARRVEADGLLVRVLTNLDADGADRVAAWEDPFRVRHVDLPSYHEVVLADRAKIALFATIDPLASAGSGGEQAVLATNAKDLILAQQALLDGLWDHGLDLPERREELASGRPADRLQVVRGRWTRLDRMKTMLYRAEELVWLTATREEMTRLEGSGVLSLMAHRTQEGISVRVIAEVGDLDPPAGLKVRSPRDPVDRTRMLIDDREALDVLQTRGDPDALTGTGDWALWLSVDEELARMRSGFERAWDALAEAEAVAG